MHPFLTDPLLREFVLVTDASTGTRALVRRGYQRWGDALGIRGGRSSGVRTVGGGRAAHPLVELGGGERVLVRAYRRGGMMRHVNGGRYFLGHRAFDELRATEHAAASGVRVPVVIAALERAARPGYTAALVTRWIPGGGELSAWLVGKDEGAAARVLHESGEQVGKMHAAGVAHPDLNLRNLLVTQLAGDPRVYLLDFDRARLFAGAVPGARRARDLRRLARSARKLGAPIARAGWEVFRDGYGAGWPEGVRLG
ncbi:MAG: hypothetical protein KY464_05730 [Gemmatimonadetes bacterium]|nr:hypothetical protein [Gemmatimonadota bacterium]